MRKPTARGYDLGSGPVMPLLLRMSLPAIGMMLLNTLVFLVDSIYVSWLGEPQMAAMSLSLPIMIAYFAFMEGVGSGATALVGQNLGRGTRRTAQLISFSALTLAYAISLLCLPLIFRGSCEWLLNALGADGDAAILGPGYSYNFWLPITAPFICYTYISCCVLRCQGDTITPLIALSIANLVNIILDPIFIFTFDWGIGGAAVATLMGRACACLYLVRKMPQKSSIVLPIAPFYPRPRRILFSWWGRISYVGFPVTLSTGSVAIGFGWINSILASYGNYAVAAIMMCIRIEDFAFNIIVGVCSALTPFLAFNYGRGDLTRIKEGMKAAGVISGGIMLVVGTLLFAFPGIFIQLFRPSPAAADMAKLAIRIAILSYPFTITQFIMGSLFVASGRSAYGTLSQVIRSLVVRIPAAYFFAGIWGERGIWWFQPTSWACGTACALLCAAHVIKGMKNEFMLDSMRKA